MSLIVESGVGLADAESYGSVAEADAYHAKFGNATWAALDTTAKEVSLRKGTRDLDLMFGSRWMQRRLTNVQALDWPRSYLRTRDGFIAEPVPPRIKEATFILALAASAEDVLPDQATPGMIASESVTAGPVSTSTSYVGGKSQYKQYTRVERLVSYYCYANGGIERA